MGQVVDLTGQRFGRLVVTGRVGDQVTPSGKRQPMWHCVCDCGNEKDVRGASLKAGLTKSCGCWSSEVHSHLHDNLRCIDEDGNVIKKRCSRCKQFKDVSDFYKDKRSVDGLHYICKDCESYSVEGRYNTYIQGAKARNMLFALSKKEFEEITSKPCFYCGEYSGEYLGYKYSGVDRIDSTAGYTFDNVIPCCTMCNKMKLDYNVEQWFEKMKQILEYSGYSITHELKNSNLTIQN